MGELADGGGLAGAVDADDENHARMRIGVSAIGVHLWCGRREDFHDLPL